MILDRKVVLELGPELVEHPLVLDAVGLAWIDGEQEQ